MSRHTPKQIVRDSKFRQLIAQSRGPADSYLDVFSSDFSSTGEIISASATHIVHATPSDDLEVIPVKSTNQKGNAGRTILRGHSNGPILDVSFCTLDYSLIASGGSDGTAKVWHVENPTVKTNLECAERSVIQVRWHPSCGSILGSSSGSVFRVWDVEKSQEVAAFSCPKDITSMCWNWDGSRAILTSTTEKNLRAVDPRTKQMTMIQSLHSGTKSIICEWGGPGDNFLFTTGASASRDRELCAWDLRKTTSSLFRTRLDNNSGVLRPLLDSDTGLLFLSGHGDSNVRVFENLLELSVNNSTSTTNVLPAIGNFAFTEPARSVCLLPKAACDIMGCEVSRILRVITNCIEGIRVEVPRKGAYKEFQEDLFPPTKAPRESLTVQHYARGENAPPTLIDVKILAKLHSTSDETVERSIKELAVQESTPEVNEKEDYERLAQKSQELDRRFSKFLGYQAKMKFAKAIQSKRDDSFFNLQPDTGGSDSVNISCSNKFFAVPWKGLAGPVYVGNLSKQGKLLNPTTVPVLNGHGATVNTLAFNEFDYQVLATGSDDCSIRIWRVPEEGVTSEVVASSCLDSSIKLEGGHRLSVRGTVFHPLANNVLSTFASDTNVKIWDISSGQCVVDLDSSLIGDASPCNIDWSYNGNELAIAGKDSEMKLIDVRSQQKITSFPIHDGLKGCRISFLGNEQGVVTTGFGKMGDRQFKIWDLKMIGKTDPLCMVPLDSGAGVMLPFYIEDNGVLLLYAKGELAIRIFEIEGLGLSKHLESGSRPMKKFEVHKCTEFRCVGEPTAGISFLPRRYCKVNQAEFLFGYRLTPSMIESISFTIPRSQEIQQFFYDDIYPPARSNVPVFDNYKSWLQSVQTDGPNRVDLNVEKKANLSDRPLEETIHAVKKNIASSDRMRRELDEQERKKKEYEENLARMHRLAKNYEKANPNLSKANNNDDEEWED